MDLSFRLPDHAAARELPAADLALLMAMLTDRQAASATALVQATIGEAAMPTADAPLTPVHGAFNATMAAQLTRWKEP